MLPDVGMVQMYSKLANVNDLGFAWTGWAPSLHGLALLLVPTVFLPGGLPCPSETHCTIPTSALVFGGNILHTYYAHCTMTYKCKVYRNCNCLAMALARRCTLSSHFLFCVQPLVHAAVDPRVGRKH